MALKRHKPVTPSERFTILSTFDEITEAKPEKTLLRKHSKKAGRNNKGRITVRHRGGGHKRRYREIDFKRDKHGMRAKVAAIHYDPNRSANIALLHYLDGEKRYILCPLGLSVGDFVQSGTNLIRKKQMSKAEKAKAERAKAANKGKGSDKKSKVDHTIPEPKTGNALPLSAIPLGTPIHNLELIPGHGGAMVRSAGTAALIMARDGDYATVKLPSSEIRRIHVNCLATIGRVGNTDHMNESMGKAGRARWKGRRPTVRGVAMNPVDHPMGGGEGRTSGGGHPRSPWGQLAKGKKTRNRKKTTSKFIVQRRKKK